MNHAALSLPQLVENLVKNWEVEAFFKPTLSDWRTIDHDKYNFAINGSEPQDAYYMLKHGTYNAIIAPNEFYSPQYSDFASSHKTFKRMMPTFAWEVTEVYSGPPTVSFRWRHWGVMKNDYVGLNYKGEQVSVKAHGGAIDIQGVTVAPVNDKLQLQSVRTWFDPMVMFRQIAPGGEVKKEAVDKNLSPGDALDSDSKAEIDQMPRPRETALPDGTAAGDAQKLMEAVGCPSAGHDGKKAGAPYDPAEATSSSDDSGEQSKLEHPNAPLSDATIEMLKSGKQEDADRDPYVELTEKTGS